MMGRRWIVVLLLAAVTHAWSQSPYFRHHYLLRKNQPVLINKIFQSSDGYLWYGTDHGLFRFDGVNTLRLTTDDGLPDNAVTAVAEDSIGRLWLGHANGMISYLQEGVVRQFKPEEGTSREQISDLLFDKAGNLWFATLNDGLYYYLRAQHRLYRLDEMEGMPDLYVYDIVMDSTGAIWAGTDGGVAICRLSDRNVEIQVLDNNTGLPDNIVRRLQYYRDTIWMATEDTGIFGCDISGQHVVPLFDDGWGRGSVTDFLISARQVWIATRQQGLMTAERKTGAIELYGSIDSEGTGVISTMNRDREGNIWIGSRSHIIMTEGDEIAFIDNLEGGNTMNVNAVAMDHKGTLWYANQSGLFRRSKDAGKTIITSVLAGTPYASYPVISLFVDDDGYIWAGLYGEGALRINPRTGNIRYLFNELRNGNVLHITGRGNTIWLATLGGCSRITTSGDSFTVMNYGSKDGLISDFIYQVFLDSKGRAWFATDGKGAVMMDETGFHHLSGGIESRVVYGFAEDDEGTILANIQGEGIYALKDGTFVPVNTEIQLRDTNINGLASDREGHVVVMHELGIDVYDARAGRTRSFGEEAGIHDQICNLNAVSITPSGEIFFGTDRGIIRVRPQSGDSLQNAPHPFIVGLKVLDRSMNMTTEMRLPHNRNSITINYLAFWYQNPSSVHFSYKLENYDNDWIESRNLSATYSSLPPAMYRFVLRVSDSDDFTDTEETSYTFEIMPPFWQTTGFYFAAGAVLILLGYLFVRNRERQLQDEKRRLEVEVAKRTAEIQRQTEEILTQSAAIHKQAEEIRSINENLEVMVQQRTHELEHKNRALEEYAFINAHELRAPVASILGLINLTDRIELEQEERIIIEHLRAAAQRLELVVGNITKAIERGDHPLPQSNIDNPDS